MSSDENLGIWRRLSRTSISRRKISRPIIRRFVREHASTERTLVLHPEEGLELFPDRYVISKRARDVPDRLVDAAFRDLDDVPAGSFRLILCIGLLEHIPAPQRFIDQLHRILEPGGKLVMTCSACFSFHECPDDYFHYTPYGIRVLCARWSRFDVLRGSCGPFTTIGILLQRILIQCEIVPLLRPVVELMAHGFPMLDRFVTRQYDAISMDEQNRCDSMLPSNLQVVVIK